LVKTTPPFLASALLHLPPQKLAVGAQTCQQSELWGKAGRSSLPLSSEEGTPSKVLIDFTSQLRPESGFDCLTCAAFARIGPPERLLQEYHRVEYFWKIFSTKNITHVPLPFTSQSNCVAIFVANRIGDLQNRVFQKHSPSV